LKTFLPLHRSYKVKMVIDSEFKACIPPLKPEEFAQLEANILQDGKINDPLMLWGEILVDGHNRHSILEKHPHLKFKTEQLPLGDRIEALLWINEHQLGRRNLTDDQRAISANDVLELRVKIARSEAATKREEEKRQAQRDESARCDQKPQSKEGVVRKSVATKYELPEKKLRHAQRIKKADVNIYGMVRSGHITLNEGNKLAALLDEVRGDAVNAVYNGMDVRTAVRRAKKKGYDARIEATKPKPLEGTYRIFYVDPPWKYHGLNQADEYGHAERHYDCLDDQQLIDFKPDGERLINELADDNAVLFCWVTAPLLKRSFPIIEAWGFEYKANFVWDKDAHVMGFYNSVRHEHLLIATKGKCKPDLAKLFNSVQRIKRTEHSRKPTEFYGIIETLYDHGRKLEIFARSGRKGWDAVGNEMDLRRSRMIILGVDSGSTAGITVIDGNQVLAAIDIPTHGERAKLTSTTTLCAA
jgi:N6-adenosine-specific RNA methylase IME4